MREMTQMQGCRFAGQKGNRLPGAKCGWGCGASAAEVGGQAPPSGEQAGTLNMGMKDARRFPDSLPGNRWGLGTRTHSLIRGALWLL